MTQVSHLHPHFTGIIDSLDLAPEMAQLRQAIQSWAAQPHPEMHEAMAWQFGAGSKYFRPLTLFSCHRAMSKAHITRGLIHAALAVEMVHNVSLIIDDIVDKSDARRGKPTLHHRFGELQAPMTFSSQRSDIATACTATCPVTIKSGPHMRNQNAERRNL